MKINSDHLDSPGCYSLDMYCKWENPKHGWYYKRFPVVYIDELGSKCRQQARYDGWILHRDGSASCPLCAKEL